MDFTHHLLNIFLPPLTIIAFVFLSLPLYVFKLFSYVKRSLSSENVAAKVVLITGAASGIGKEVAYEYARRGSCLSLVDIREEGLGAVADESRRLGSPDVITIGADVTQLQHCERFVQDTIHHFGRLDHLVNNAGIVKMGFLGTGNVSDFTSIMDVNFWGPVYGTHFAIPELRKSKGKVIVVSSVCGWYPLPQLGFYNASKAAVIGLYETLRSEMGRDIGVTIVTPGFIRTEMASGQFEQEVGDIIPEESGERCAKAIVKSVCRGDMYLTEPSWTRVLFLYKTLCPELTEWCNHNLFVTRIINRNKIQLNPNSAPHQSQDLKDH